MQQPEIEKQSWTLSGHPIVNGKYLDKNGNIREIEPDEWTTNGPPVLDVYWTNRKVSPTDDLVGSQFRVIASGAFVDVTEYLSRVGEFLRAVGGACLIMSLNATLYSVNVIVSTDLSQREMQELLLQHHLAPAH
ncbi:hypothetical protein V8C35DRAFT_305750 [Trichoderma chlorosporum]